MAKLSRKLQKIFGENAGQDGKTTFGSIAQTGEAVFSDDAGIVDFAFCIRGRYGPAVGACLRSLGVESGPGITGIDETVIADGIRILDDLVECGLQFCALFAIGTAIVGASVVGALSPHTGPSQSHDHCYYLFSHDSLLDE